MNQTSDTLSLFPAYGRRYASGEAAQADWQAGKDFKIIGGPYCSRRDAQAMLEMGFTSVKIHTANGWQLVQLGD